MLYFFGRPFRRQIFRQLLRDYRRRIADGKTLPELEALTDALFHAYRSNAQSQRPRGPLSWLDQRLDEAIHTQKPERMDLRGPTLERHLRNIECLDQLNRTFGSYGRFERYLLAWCRRFVSAGRPLRLLDLASGHGAFPIHLARQVRDRGLPLEVTGSDIDADYVALARVAAEQQTLPVNFIELNALDMADLADDQVDIITCTQSIHHFSPGQLARMMREASRVARYGLILIDGKRSIAAAAGVALLIAATTGNPDTVHDGWVSLRKMYFPEELQFIAQVACVPNAEVNLHPPGFVVFTGGKGV